jgi:hypothetical protein
MRDSNMVDVLPSSTPSPNKRKQQRYTVSESSSSSPLSDISDSSEYESDTPPTRDSSSGKIISNSATRVEPSDATRVSSSRLENGLGESRTARRGGLKRGPGRPPNPGNLARAQKRQRTIQHPELSALANAAVDASANEVPAQEPVPVIASAPQAPPMASPSLKRRIYCIEVNDEDFRSDEAMISVMRQFRAARSIVSVHSSLPAAYRSEATLNLHGATSQARFTDDGAQLLYIVDTERSVE